MPSFHELNEFWKVRLRAGTCHWDTRRDLQHGGLALDVTCAVEERNVSGEEVDRGRSKAGAFCVFPETPRECDVVETDWLRLAQRVDRHGRRVRRVRLHPAPPCAHIEAAENGVRVPRVCTAEPPLYVLRVRAEVRHREVFVAALVLLGLDWLVHASRAESCVA
eukprot:2503598-Rhodomonas_salina.1